MVAILGCSGLDLGLPLLAQIPPLPLQASGAFKHGGPQMLCIRASAESPCLWPGREGQQRVRRSLDRCAWMVARESRRPRVLRVGSVYRVRAAPGIVGLCEPQGRAGLGSHWALTLLPADANPEEVCPRPLQPPPRSRAWLCQGAANSALSSEETVFSFLWLYGRKAELECDRLYHQVSPPSELCTEVLNLHLSRVQLLGLGLILELSVQSDLFKSCILKRAALASLPGERPAPLARTWAPW